MNQESIIRDIITESRKTKTAYVTRCKDLGVSPELLAEQCGMKPDDFHAWLEGVHIPSQLDVIKLLKYVGVDVRVDLVFNPIEEINQSWKKP